jgi:hypothetical protein
MLPAHHKTADATAYTGLFLLFSGFAKKFTLSPYACLGIGFGTERTEHIIRIGLQVKD